MNDTILILNIVVTVLVVLFVTLAMGQIIVFNLTKKTKKNLSLHKGIAYLGMGAAFYALFLARIHFSDAGWLGLVGAVIGIVFVGSIIQKYKKTKSEPPPEKMSPPTKKKRSEKAESQGKEKGKPSSGWKRIEVFLALFWALVFIGMLLWYFLGN
jgi:H+/gluconate symporter-like permease